jgi:uncharacterized protein (TIGR00251 family)
MGRVALHIVPRARATVVAGAHGDAVKIRIAAPPVDGAANAELLRFLAAHLNVAATRVTIVGGAGGRRKTVAVEGMGAQEIRGTLLALGPE